MRYLFFLIPCLVWSQTYEVGLVGVASDKSPTEAFETYNPLVQHLSRKVYGGMVKGGLKLRVYKTEKELMKVLYEGTIQIAQVKPQTYIQIKNKLPQLKICAGEITHQRFSREAVFIVQKRNNVRSFADLKGYPFAFGPKTDPLLDIVAKAFLNEKGLKIKDIQQRYLEDPEKIKEFVEIGRVRGGVIEKATITDTEINDKFRVFGSIEAPGTIWIISDALFLSTREKIKSEMLDLQEKPILRLLGIDGFIDIRDQSLVPFKNRLFEAMDFYKPKK